METVEPQKITKREGEPLTLVCPIQNEDLESEARKESELRITWAKNGRPLESSLSPNYEVLFFLILLNAIKIPINYIYSNRFLDKKFFLFIINVFLDIK